MDIQGWLRHMERKRCQPVTFVGIEWVCGFLSGIMLGEQYGLISGRYLSKAGKRRLKTLRMTSVNEVASFACKL